MAFIFEWGDFAVLETSIDIDADLVIDAATHAQSLWPEDADLPEDREHSPRPWATRSSAAMFRKTQT